MAEILRLNKIKKKFLNEKNFVARKTFSVFYLFILTYTYAYTQIHTAVGMHVSKIWRNLHRNINVIVKIVVHS